ncbi:MAG: hypothetical protein ACPHVY_11040, partial [Candidatus Puniceispirillaceae bacterium]
MDDSRETGTAVPVLSRTAFRQRLASGGGPLPLVLLLAACGGGGGGATPMVSAPVPKTPSPAPAPAPAPATAPAPVVPPSSATEDERSSAVSGSLYDGPIEGARVYVDANRNRRVDDGDRLIDEATDENGNFEGSIPDHLRDLPLIASNSGAKHRGSKVELPAYFVAPAGSGVISPLTHIIEIDVVREDEITTHILFHRFQPFNHNPYEEGVNHVFRNQIETFLPELTALIASTPDHEELRSKVLALLDEYLLKIRKLDQSTTQEAPDLPELQLTTITDLEVDENSTVLTGTAQLGITTREGGDHAVEYRLADGAAHDFVTVLPNGSIHLKQAPDHEVMPRLDFAVEVRYARAGQDAD